MEMKNPPTGVIFKWYIDSYIYIRAKPCILNNSAV